MKTHNWQTKALILFIAAAAALRLTVGRGKEALHPDSSAHGPGGQGNTGKRRTLFLAIFGGGLFVVVLAIGAVLYLRTPPYEDILGLEPCVDDMDFDALAIVESPYPPFHATVHDDWSLDVREYSYRGSVKAIRDAGRVALEHEERFKAIPAFASVAVNRLSLRDQDTDNMKGWSVRHGIIAYIDYPWSGRREDLYRWLPGCLDGYPVLAAKEFSAMFARDSLVPPRWGAPPTRSSS